MRIVNIPEDANLITREVKQSLISKYLETLNMMMARDITNTNIILELVKFLNKVRSGSEKLT